MAISDKYKAFCTICLTMELTDEMANLINNMLGWCQKAKVGSHSNKTLLFLLLLQNTYF